MPCVFPVLSLKLIGLAQHRTHSGPMAAHGIAFAVGVVLSFVLLAALLIGLQQAGSALGWGFQLQTPWVVAALTVLFFAIGLNLLGVFEMTMGTGVANMRAADNLASKSDWRGSFGTGVLAVIVASPCTAPFMGAALGYAITQPAVIALSVFAALGVGMAAPYVLLTLFPSLLAKLPRPGRWMEMFKQFMAFPMFATCVWLLWVLAQQVDAGGIALALGRSGRRGLHAVGTRAVATRCARISLGRDRRRHADRADVRADRHQRGTGTRHSLDRRCGVDRILAGETRAAAQRRQGGVCRFHRSMVRHVSAEQARCTAC